MQQLETYLGLADCHGLVSFIPDPVVGKHSFTDILIFGEDDADKNKKERNDMVNGMYMSAYHNSQRRTVVYQAKVTHEVANEIKELLADGENIDALIVLKDRNNEIGILQGLPNAKKFWEQIPNPDLDPFHG